MTDYGATNTVFLYLAAPTVTTVVNFIPSVPFEIIKAFDSSGPIRGTDGLVWPNGVQRFGSPAS